MLKKITLEELNKCGHAFTQHIDFLVKQCSGILRNEIQKKFEQEQDLKNQQNIVDSIKEFNKIIATVNEALKKGNAERLRVGLLQYYSAVETLFKASQAIHSNHELPYDKENGVVKGRYLEAHRFIIEGCKKAKMLVEEDRHLKGEVGNSGKLAESVTQGIKEICSLLDIKTKMDRTQKVKLSITTPIESRHALLAPPNAHTTVTTTVDVRNKKR